MTSWVGKCRSQAETDRGGHQRIGVVLGRRSQESKHGLRHAHTVTRATGTPGARGTVKRRGSSCAAPQDCVSCDRSPLIYSSLPLPREKTPGLGYNSAARVCCARSAHRRRAAIPGFPALASHTLIAGSPCRSRSHSGAQSQSSQGCCARQPSPHSWPAPRAWRSPRLRPTRLKRLSRFRPLQRANSVPK